MKLRVLFNIQILKPSAYYSKSIIILYFFIFFISGNLVAQVNLTSSLSACYALNGSGIEPINNLTGTLSSITATVDRFNNVNSASQFNYSSSSYIELPNSSLLKPTTGVSFSGWIKTNLSTIDQYIVFAHNGCTNYHEGYALVVVPAGGGLMSLAVAKSSSVTCSPSTQPVLYSVSSLSINTWYHVGFYIGNDSMKIYLNGALNSALASTVQLTYNSGANVYLGGSNLSNFNRPFSGSMDNIRFYNRKLNGNEFAQLYLTDPSCFPPPPVCSNTVYALSSSGSLTPVCYSSNISNPSSISNLPLVAPNGSDGFAIGPPLGFTAPNPTYWTIMGGTYWYFNGVNFVNTNHTAGNSGALHPGGSINRLYNIDPGTGNVYTYNGTGNATLLTTITTSPGDICADVVGDDNNNFYLLRTSSPQALNVYNSLGSLICTYSVTGVPTSTGAVALAVWGNTVGFVSSSTNYTGTISGSVVNFTTSGFTFPVASDYASCYLNTSFASSISASPGASISCTSPTITLTANATPASLSYTWSGPGIVSAINASSVQVNTSGTYSCFMRSCVGGTSSTTFNVLNGIINATVISNGTLTCTNPTVQLFVFPGPPNSILWSGPGIVGSNTTQIITVNAGGTYSAVSTDSNSCNMSGSVNVISTIAPLTVSISPSSATRCLPSSGISLTASGAVNYAWLPLASVSPTNGSSVVASPTLNTTYTVLGSNGVCTGSATATISVANSPTLTNSIGNPTICSGNSTPLSVTGASNYTWLPGNMSTGSVTVSPAATTVYTVIGANGSCNTSITLTVTVIASPTLNTASVPSSICLGGTSMLVAGTTGSLAVSYTWQPLGVSGSTVNVSPSVTTIYTVVGSNGSCSGTNTVLVTVYPIPTVQANASPSVICLGNTVTLTATGATAYTWQPGNLNSSTVTISPTSSVIYTLTGSSNNCPTTETVSVIVNQLPSINATANPGTVCVGSSATLSAAGAVTYTWFPLATTGQSIVVTPSVSSNYSVVGTGSNGCIASAPLSVSVAAFPLVSVTNNFTSTCVGSTFSLTASGSATNYTWQPLGSNNSSLAITVYANITYTLIYSNGFCSGTYNSSLTVSPVPTLAITPAQPTICLGSSVTLSVSGATSYTWYPSFVTGSVSLVTPSTTSVYSVTGNNGLLCSRTETARVFVNSPTIAISGNTTNVCAGQNAVLTATGGVSYTWQPGGVVSQTLSVTPSVTTVYTVTGQNTLNCSASATFVVYVNPNPFVTASANPSFVCPGNSSILSSFGANSYTWFPMSTPGQTISVSPTSNTTYSVTGTSSLGCTASTLVTVGILSVSPVFAIANPTAICLGDIATLSAGGASTYTWQPNNLSGQNVTVSPLSTTVYTLSGSANGCSSSTTLSLLVNQLPNVLITPPAVTICPGLSLTLNASGAVNYTWFPGNVPGSSIVVSPLNSSVYSVTGTNSFGCVNSTTASVVVNSVSTISISSPTTSICKGDTITLSASGAVNYTWFPGPLIGSSQTVSPASGLTYTVIGSSGGGCSNVAYYNLSVLSLPDILITSSESLICSGSSSSLQATGVTSFSWIPLASLSSSSSAQVIASPSTTTTYTLYGSLNGCSNSAAITVSVKPSPLITITQSTNSICQGYSVLLSANGGEGYTWLPDNQTSQTLSLTPNSSFNYTLIGTDFNGCYGNATVSVNVIPTPTITGIPASAAICSGDSYTLNVSGATNFSWMPFGETGNLIVITPSSNVVYTVFGSDSGCSSISTITISMVNCETGVFGVTNAASIPLLSEGKYYRVSFTVTAVNASNLPLHQVKLNSALRNSFPLPCTYTVISAPRITSGNTGLSANSLFDGDTELSLTSSSTSTALPNKRDTLEYTILVNPNGFSGLVKHSVIGIAEQENLILVSDSSNNGFVWDPDQDGDPTNNNEVTLIDIKLIDLFIPEGFSPNGDGINDLLVIKGIENKPTKFTVFNRWGNKVFSAEGSDGIRWDGKANTGINLGNNRLPQGTYYYTLEFTSENIKVVTGFIVLGY